MRLGENECKHKLDFDEADFVCCPYCFDVIKNNMPGNKTAYDLVNEKIKSEKARFDAMLSRYRTACMTLFAILIIADGYFVSDLRDWHVYISTCYLFFLMGVLAAVTGRVYSRRIIKKVYNLKLSYFAAFLISMPVVAALFFYRKAAALPIYARSFAYIKDLDGGLEQMQRTADYSYASCAAISLMFVAFVMLCVYRYRTAAELTQKAEELDEMCYAQENQRKYQYRYRVFCRPQEQKYGQGWYV